MLREEGNVVANYCSNNIAFYCEDNERLEAFRKLMVSSFRESRHGTVRDFVVKCGCSQEEAIQFTDGRDTFVDIADELSEKEGVFYFIAQTESAWSPNLEVFFKVIRDKFDDEFGIEYCSEEPGMAIYINTDVEGFFFPDRYYLDSCINNDYETEYFQTKQEVLSWIKDKFPEANVNIKTALHKIESEVRKYIDESGDDFFTLYQFSYD